MIGELPNADPCPRCGSTHSARWGFIQKIQRLRCRQCGKRYQGQPGPRMRNPRPPRIVRPRLSAATCYRCGGSNCRVAGKSGMARQWFCRVCRRHFVMGGRRDLALNLKLILEPRVAALRAPAELGTVLLNNAIVAVLEGKGYCATIPLDVTAAKREVYGEFRNEAMDRGYRALTA